MKTLSKEIVEKTIKSKGYKWFEDKLNVVGIRTSDNTPDKFNDYITISYKDKTGKWQFIGYEATTDPGVYWLKNPQNVKGTAILVPGQYIDTWVLGKHSGYEAFVQSKQVSVYRDNDKNDRINIDTNKIYTGYFGINIHRAHLQILQWIIGKYSAGCQVFRRATSLDTLIKLFKEKKQDYLTYTLLVEEDFN